MCENCNSKTWKGEYFGTYIIKPKIEEYNLPQIKESIELNRLSDDVWINNKEEIVAIKVMDKNNNEYWKYI